MTGPEDSVDRALSPRDIAALIHLLGDEDGWVKEHARARLRDAGELAAPLLERAREDDTEPAVRRESEGLLEEILVDEVERDWVALQAVEDGTALREGAFLLERLIHPDRGPRQVEARTDLDEIVAGARLAVPPGAGAAARFDALREYLHETCGFHGNADDYYDPENSFLSSVVARRTGVPITLALIYLDVGLRIGLNVVGVGMPMHFLVGRRAGGSYRYVDPFYGGREVSRGECLLLLEQAGFEPAEEYLQPAPVVAILERMARNLIVSYQHAGRDRERRLAGRFVTLLTGEVVQ